MRRSEIDSLIDKAKIAFERHAIRLPPFGYWSAADWQIKGAECQEIRDCHLGWDVTDFGSGDFAQTGLTVFTVRNGTPNHHAAFARYARTVYCEKLLIAEENQVTPMHCHHHKQEDIICRAGGNLVVQLYNRALDGRLDTTDVTVSLDGVAHQVTAGHCFILHPGESIRLTPQLYHRFYGEPGTGPCIAGEVSTVNDDAGDNIFLEDLPRFPAIIEDAPRRHLLCTEYDRTDPL